jgi:Domain of unknown function (DUF1772)
MPPQGDTRSFRSGGHVPLFRRGYSPTRRKGLVLNELATKFRRQPYTGYHVSSSNGGLRWSMLLLLLATACAGLFCGAALYVNLVEHPARISCGQELAVREFAPSYQRATIMQASLAIAGLAFGLGAAWQLHAGWVVASAVLLGASVPFTLVIILPTNKKLLNSALDPQSTQAADLLRRWNRLHGVRTALSAASFGLFLWCVAASGEVGR